jgi:hypothetical protein
MPTLADLFTTCYLTGGNEVDFSAIRLHYRGVDEVCRAFGAAALTVGSDIYFRQEAFAPHTTEGLRLLAHEVAHVVQQRRGAVAAPQAAGGLAVAPAGSRNDCGPTIQAPRRCACPAGTLVALRQWHDSSLRDLCFGELFSLWRTSATRVLASAVCRRFGVPSPDIEALRNG